MEITFSAANAIGLNNPGTEIITLVKDGSGNFINPPSYDKIRAYLRSGEVPMLFVTTEGGETGSLYQLVEYSETENKIRFSNDVEAIEFVAGAAAPVVSDVGGGSTTTDVLIIHATPDETGANAQLDKTAEQIYEAYQGGKYCLVDFNGTFLPVTSVKTKGARYLMSSNGFEFPTSEQGSAAGFDLATSDGVTWSVTKRTPSLYNARFNGLQISGPGNQYYTISVDTNGNLTATAVT